MRKLKSTYEEKNSKISQKQPTLRSTLVKKKKKKDNKKWQRLKQKESNTFSTRVKNKADTRDIHRIFFQKVTKETVSQAFHV